MELHEFAERVLFSETLEEKLAPPPDLSDGRRRSAVLTPAAPGRPEALTIARSEKRAGFPGLSGVHDASQRGLLLHFFANHELLATELMALVLLKFPDAPAPFREGVLRTLKEEQMHTKLYLKRMGECGVQFGDHPVNGFFWDCVSTMETPLDYVTRLSLTFEQANLDYARHFSDAFAEAGDARTAALLKRIYQDEITHVNYGLKWFRQWKRKDDDDWGAYRANLPFPLTAARAKSSLRFNEDGRRAAGLDESFIQELRVYSHSKGRTPNIYFFNPLAEYECASPDYQPSAIEQSLSKDLSILPAFLAREDDIALVSHKPSLEFLCNLADQGLPLPQLIESTGHFSSPRPSAFMGRALHGLRPWGWSPSVSRIEEDFGGMLREQRPPCTPQAATAYSKVAHHKFSHALATGAAGAGFAPALATQEDLGCILTSPDGLVDGLQEIWEAGYPTAIVKAPFSTAGRDRRQLKYGSPLAEADSAWVASVLEEHGVAVLEPWVERLFDFSIQYQHTQGERLRRLGIVHLANTRRGQFRSATRRPKFGDGLPPRVHQALFRPENGISGGWLHPFLDEVLEPGLTDFLEGLGHRGPAGVDLYFFEAPDRSVRLRPVVEINPRFTMGRVTLELAKRAVQRANVRFEIAPVGSLPPPVPARLAPDGRILHGSIYLNDPQDAEQFGAMLHVE